MVLKVSWIKILFIKLTSSSKHSMVLSKTGIEVHLMHEFMPPEPFLVLGQRTCPIDYFRSKTHVFGWFHAIYSMHPTRCGNWYRGAFDWMFKNSKTLDILLERFQCTPLGPKLIFWVFSHHFGALKRPFGFARHTLGLKLVFWVVSCHFVAAPNPLWKSASVCI